MDETNKRVKELLMDKLVLDDLPKDTDDLYNDLGCDSLDAVEIIMDCENEFKCVISDEDAEGVRTVEDFVNLVKKSTGQL
jgi:acyl carrier protein